MNVKSDTTLHIRMKFINICELQLGHSPCKFECGGSPDLATNINNKMLINSLSQISTDYNPELQTSECLAVHDFKKGEQLFIFYGARSNADLFLHNG